MRALAGFIMRGRLAAALVVTGSIFLLPLVWLSGPALALVTLRRGLAEGALLAAAAVAVVAAVGASGGRPDLALTPLLYVWLPVLAMATVLRSTRSLPLTIAAACGVGLAGLALFHLVVGNVPEFWAARLDAFRDATGWPAVQEGVWSGFRARLAAEMTGLVVLNEVAVTVLSLLLARWWQALLYNPGGFRAEFHALRLPKALAAAALACVVGGMVAGPGMMRDAGILLFGAFALQAMAVLHAVVAARGLGRAWLVPGYLMLPVAARVVALIGVVDAFVDLRQRLTGPTGGAR